MKKIVLFYATLALFFVSCTHQSAPTKSARIPSSDSAQQRVDDDCFVYYSQSAGRCNSDAGQDDAAFDRCLEPVKAEFRKCCRVNNGSPNCGSEAPPLNRQAQKSVDDSCFVAYSQAAGRCNSFSDESAFMGCLRPVKAQLKICCQDNGGSANCAADAH